MPMTLLQKRDAILESLRCQFNTKVQAIVFKGGIADHTIDSPKLQALLLDIANNAAQALAEDE